MDLPSNRCLPCLGLTAPPTVTVNGINALFRDSGRTEAVPAGSTRPTLGKLFHRSLWGLNSIYNESI